MLLANGIQWENELLAKVSRPYVAAKPAKVGLHRRLVPGADSGLKSDRSIFEELK